jgi:hypothetical protein
MYCFLTVFPLRQEPSGKAPFAAGRDILPGTGSDLSTSSDRALATPTVGALHHVIVRGIDRQAIVSDKMVMNAC